jgi:ParB family chromosome partitioning protein
MLAETVESDGGAVIGSFRDPLGGNWQLLIALPVDRVAPTPFQRDLSEPHVKRLSVFRGPRSVPRSIIVVPGEGVLDPNRHHRLPQCGRSADAPLPRSLSRNRRGYRILALNTEKAHNLREKALEVIRMARDLARLDAGTEAEFAKLFEEPILLTLGACYEQRGRFAGSAYQSVLRKIDGFLRSRLPRALEERQARAAQLFEVEDAVALAVAALKERGFQSPYLRNIVVARIDPLRFQRGKKADFQETMEKMLRAALRFDPVRIKADDIARAGGPVE